MIKRGRASVLFSARKEAIEILRDAHTALQTGEFGPALALHARIARDAADRLLTLAAMWDETTSTAIAPAANTNPPAVMTPNF